MIPFNNSSSAVLLLCVCTTLVWGEQSRTPSNLRRTSGISAVGTVTKLRLINADTNLPITGFDPLPASLQIDVATLPTPNLSIEALTNGTVRSVSWRFANINRMENAAPWAMCLNNGADFYTCARLVEGFNATITVTPFSLASGGGTRGTPLSIHLSLVRGSGAVPTKAPTAIPTKAPVTLAPTKAPTKAPVVATVDPTLVSTTTTTPTKAPTKAPVVVATVDPTIVPVTAAPTKTPTKAPVVATVDPTIAPVTAPPTKAPTKAPVVVATVDPTVVPVTMAPTKAPTKAPVATPAPAVPPTNAPVTICPSITEYINSITLSGRTLTANHSAFVPEDRASPEDKALRTLVDADRMSLIDLKPCNARNRFLLLQKFALLTLHHQYKSPSYPWRNSTNWGNMAMDECTWFGIFCTPVSIVGDNGQDLLVQAVTEVRLGRNNLNGYFPPDLALLRHMVTFDIDLNMDMRGTLPSTVYAWTDLKTFIARNVRFPGPMPTALGMWTNLEHLAMSFYDRRGDLYHSGPLPGDVMARWTKIKHVYFESTGFTGTFPALLGEKWTNLEYLFFSSHFDIRGTLPPSIGNWTNVKTVRLPYQSLTGSLPSTLAQWTKLEELDLMLNRFSNTIPAWMGTLTSLRDLRLAENTFVGTLPSTLGDLTKLTTLRLSRNLLTGTIPATMARLTSVTTGDFSINALNGTMPSQWCTALPNSNPPILKVDCAEVSCPCCGCP